MLCKFAQVGERFPLEFQVQAKMFQTEWSPRPADCTAGPAVVGEGLYENIAFSIFMGALFDVANRFVPGLILPMAYPPYTKLADKSVRQTSYLYVPAHGTNGRTRSRHVRTSILWL